MVALDIGDCFNIVNSGRSSDLLSPVVTFSQDSLMVLIQSKDCTHS